MTDRDRFPGLRTHYVVLVILSALCIFVPAAAVYGFMAMILPGFAIIAAPTLLLYGVLAEGARWAVPRWPITAALIAIVAIAIGGPALLNRPLTREVDALHGADRSLAGGAARPAGVALLLWTPPRNLPTYGHAILADRTACNAYCQRLLLGGEAQRVLVGVPSPGPDPLAAVRVADYRIERRRACPPADLPEDDGLPPIDGERAATGVVELRIAQGECLIRRTGNLADADIVIVDRPLDAPSTRGEPLVSATEMRAFRPGASGWREVFRRTATVARPILTPLIYTRDGAWLEHLGFLRHQVRRGEYTTADVLRTTFGYRLRAPASMSDDAEAIRSRLRAGLARPDGRADDPDLMLVDQYLRGIADGGGRNEDAELIAAIVANDAVPGDRLMSLGAAIRQLGSRAVPLGPAMLDRIGRTRLPEHPRDRDIVQVMARGIQALPPGAAAPLYPRLSRLAEDPARANLAGPALTRLADRGPAALDRIADLAGLAPGSSAREETAVPATIALCRLGRDGAASAPLVAASIRRRAAAQDGSSLIELLWITLELQGAAARLFAALDPHGDERLLVERWRRTARDPVRACSTTYW